MGTFSTLKVHYACGAMKSYPAQSAIILALLVIFIGLVGLSEFFHTCEPTAHRGRESICFNRQHHVEVKATVAANKV
jgi:hypothetical protein